MGLKDINSEIKSLKEYIYKYELGHTLDNVSFKCLTTLGIGGTCQLFYIPTDVEALTLVMKYIYISRIKYLIIGAGSNLLVDDKEFEIVVISLKNIKRCYIEGEDNDCWYIYAEAGLRGPALSNYLTEHNIHGAEFLSIIPGTIGGLTYMNAGAYKKSMADIIYSVTFIDGAGLIKTVNNVDDNFKFKYRKSIFKENGNVILSVILKLNKNLKLEDSKTKIKRYIDKKKNTQPLQTKNAGSTFINLPHISTWELIDSLGYRGYKLGGAMVSSKHANFLINESDATFNDMISLINLIKEDIYKTYNEIIECEWEIIK